MLTLRILAGLGAFYFWWALLRMTVAVSRTETATILWDSTMRYILAAIGCTIVAYLGF